jgi:hypothetical protein
MTDKEIKAALLIPGTRFRVNRNALNYCGPIFFEMGRFTEDRNHPGDGMSVSNTSKTFSSANVDKITSTAITFYTYSPFLTLTKDRIKFSEIEIIRVGPAGQEA